MYNVQCITASFNTDLTCSFASANTYVKIPLKVLYNYNGWSNISGTSNGAISGFTGLIDVSGKIYVSGANSNSIFVVMIRTWDSTNGLIDVGGPVYAFVDAGGATSIIIPPTLIEASGKAIFIYIKNTYDTSGTVDTSWGTRVVIKKMR